jgi:hypothetical protein
VKDAWATLEAVETLEQRIAADYPDSPKLSRYSRQWYSDLLWTCITMEEDGVAFDVPQLDKLDFDLTCKSALVECEARHLHDLVLSGKGSQKSKQALFQDAVNAANLAGDPSIETTPKRKDIAVSIKNASTLLEHLDPANPLAYRIRLEQKHVGHQKTLTTYTRPMLHGTPRNPTNCRLLPVVRTRHRNLDCQIAYPSWFPVPSHFDVNQGTGAGSRGGTIQGRITSKSPPCQTFPKNVKACLTSRYDPGFLLCVDLSQIELRVGALLSGDPLMIQEYEEGIDRHSITGKLVIHKLLQVYPDRQKFEVGNLTYERQELEAAAQLDSLKFPEGSPGFKRWNIFRQIGKTTNFLILFRGGAYKLRATVADDLGVVLPLPVCEAIIAEIRGRYPRFNEWQEELIAEAKRTFRLELPLLGQSRIFVGSSKVIDDTYVPEICNFKIQTIAATIMLDIQGALHDALADCKPRVYMGLNIYDSVFLDGPARQYQRTLVAVHQCFSNSVFYRDLCQALDKSVPIEYDISTLCHFQPEGEEGSP